MDAENDEEDRKQRERDARCIRLTKADDDGNTHYDPATGKKYMECISCFRMMFLPNGEHHSAMECNLCHAVNKDD